MPEAPIEADATAVIRPRRLRLRTAALVLGTVLLVIVGREASRYLPQFTEYVQGLGLWGPVVFIIGYVVATVALMPAFVLTLAAGVIFGLVAGAAYVFVAATLGSAAAFLVSRHLARGIVARRLSSTPKFAAIDRAIGEQGRKIVFLLRLSPVFPFVLVNYALGLTQVRFSDYVLASAGMMPATVVYVYYGKLIGDLAALASGTAPEAGTSYYVITGLGLLATVAVTTMLTRVATRALRAAADNR